MFFISSMIFISIITLIMILFLTKKIYSFEIMSKIKNKYLRYVITCIPTLISIPFLWIDYFNTIVVLFTLIVFWGIGDFICYVIKKISKKQIKKMTKGIAILSITTIYFVIGFYLAHHVVETKYLIETEKNIGLEKFRITQISDSHIGATMDGNKFYEYMDRINDTNPDIVVITGDYVDDDTKFEDMKKSCEGLGKLKTNYGVYFIYGNHDKGYFDYRDFDDDDLRKELKKNNVIILEDDIIELINNIYLIGRQDRTVKDRASAQELVKNLDKSRYIIDLNHQPNDYKNEKEAGMDLVLAGHTHGGQFFPIGQLGTLFGFNDGYYGLEKRGNTNFIINSGLGDWNLKFKIGTVSEYTVIDIVQK